MSFRADSGGDVATGPCVPVSSGGKALCSPLGQDRGETPRQTAALYTVLTGRSAGEVLVEVERSGAGVLYRCADEFVEAMADANQLLVRLGDQDEAAGDGEFSRSAAQWAVYDRTWLAAGEWPSEVASTRNRLTRLVWRRLPGGILSPFTAGSGRQWPHSSSEHPPSSAKCSP